MSRTFVVVPLCMLMFACASEQPLPTAGLDQGIVLKPGTDPGTLIYSAQTVAPSAYRNYLVEPTIIYSGADADFGGVSEADKAALAAQMNSDFTAALLQTNAIATKPGPGVAKLQLTLVGIAESHPVISTIARLNPVGVVMTAFNSATDKPASFTGSVTISGEYRDSQTGKVLGGFVDKANPAAYDLTSGLGKLRAAQLGVTRAAHDFGNGLSSLVEKAQPAK